MLFAAGLVIEREPMKWSELPAALRSWAEVAGTVAAIGLVIWFIAYVVQNRSRGLLPRDATGWAFAFMFGLSVCLFALIGLAFLGRSINIRALAQFVPSGEPVHPVTRERMPPNMGDWILAFAGLSALIAVATPVVLDLIFKMRWGRI